ncbi:MAG TPA: 4a-hydroxytetrahydrobiopterin dehydratase [Fimbriimonadales bacterium]|jgi:4a-hydroxytetrahydrobiopterin dehydratase|nr:4a-hydroxytetrahydrobiopterin dehydratase [Fimbriimonadales bacterium]
MAQLSSAEIEAFLARSHGWSAQDSEIVKTFEFPTYVDGLVFAVACGRLAEKRDHHPDMLITWRKVRCSLSTHSEGGITQKDLDLAAEIDGLI